MDGKADLIQSYLIAKKELFFRNTWSSDQRRLQHGQYVPNNGKACQQFLCQIDGVMFDDLVNLTFNFKMTQCAALCAMNRYYQMCMNSDDD